VQCTIWSRAFLNFLIRPSRTFQTFFTQSWECGKIFGLLTVFMNEGMFYCHLIVWTTYV
jgi:hypothetical protein